MINLEVNRIKLGSLEITECDIDRFNSKIFIVTEGEHIGCHETIYAKSNGYSSIIINDKMINVHRLMYQIHHPDEDIDNLFICHRCDNPACVNPEHLFSGTHQDNMTDRRSKNRQAKGSENGNSTLIESDVVEMLNLVLSGNFTSYKDIAKHYNVSRGNINKIINQKMWIHITKDYDMVKIKSLLYNDRIGSNSSRALFNDDQVREIRARLKNGESRQRLADFYLVNYVTISQIDIGKTYQNVV